MGIKSGTGKVCIILFSIVYSLGFWVSVFSPSWLSLTYSDPNSNNAGGYIESRLGPFYGQTQACTANGVCTGWRAAAIDTSDCDRVEQEAGAGVGDYCRKTNTWRITAIICFIAQFVTAALVCMGACCQAFTCGCCGASLDLLAMIIYWIEVILSIVAWSFAIVANNMVNNANVEGVGGGYEWAFWLFIVTGTILGAICAMLTSWASDDSIIRKCFRCVFCCCRKGDD
eukprot:CAMPEP_0197439440 /NCGR_PEP_ID=MMETSP1175-20131217/6189_1 /TAXON_ID=1003142 /ORGANISM="Triceratium dubium, Strain CCMP147" /LENGTH=227 /DNA_ID=CAMNT_0042969357 /DNA_START=161 /DNA_END=844 /DNA_ORIENTATION=-